MRNAIANLERFIGTVYVAKHRIFFWIPRGTLPDHELIVFARDDDYTLGVLQSRIHTLWSLAKGTQVREKETGFRYTPTSTFETFPFPTSTAAQKNAIGEMAKRLDDLREGELHPKSAAAPDNDELTLTDLYTRNPTWLQHAHADLDLAVMRAYGWPSDLADGQILERLLRNGHGERSTRQSSMIG